MVTLEYEFDARDLTWRPLMGHFIMWLTMNLSKPTRTYESGRLKYQEQFEAMLAEKNIVPHSNVVVNGNARMKVMSGEGWFMFRRTHRSYRSTPYGYRTLDEKVLISLEFDDELMALQFKLAHS